MTGAWEFVMDDGDERRGVARVLNARNELVCETTPENADIIVCAVNYLFVAEGAGSGREGEAAEEQGAAGLPSWCRDPLDCVSPSCWCGSFACGICGRRDATVSARGWMDEGDPMETCAECGGPEEQGSAASVVEAERDDLWRTLKSISEQTEGGVAKTCRALAGEALERWPQDEQA